MANPTSLEELPAELLNHILDLLPKDALANLRLASKYYQPRTKEYLYRHLNLYEPGESAARLRRIIQQESLASLVREITLYRSTFARLQNKFDPAGVSALRKFSRLRSLCINFFPIIPQASSIQDNSDFFAILFSSLMISHFTSCGLDRLSITYLQSRDEPDVTTSHAFLQLIRNIRTLELDIWTVEHDNRWRPRSMSVATISFYLQLPQIWLAPASANIRMLHLSADDPWGWYPKVDFRGIYFPHLRGLTLGCFTFSHDWHLQWLSDHATSLKRLILIDCAILDHAVSTGQRFDSEGYPLGVEPRLHGDDTQVQGSHSHKKRWSHYFNAIKNTLPRLLSFSLFSSDHVFRGIDLQAVHEEEISSFCRAYSYFEYGSYGYLPLFGYKDSAFDVLSEKYKMCKGKKRAQLDEDEQALRELLIGIERRNSIGA